MSDFDAEAHVLSVFREKCRRAGGPKAGYNLRRQAIEYGVAEEQWDICAGALESLVGQGLLMSNEAGDRFILTEEGAETIAV